MFLLRINVPPKGESNPFLKWTMCVFFFIQNLSGLFMSHCNLLNLFAILNYS